MKFFINLTVVLALLLNLKLKGDNLKSNADSTRKNAEELVRIINAGFNSDEVVAFIDKTKIKDFVTARIDTYAEKLTDDKGKYFLYYGLASVYFDSGNTNDAQPLLIKALAIAEKIKNVKYQVGVYNLMANMFAFSHMSDNAFQNFKRAIKLAGEIKEEKVMCTLYNNLATCFYRAWESNFSFLDSARFYNNKCLEMAIKLDSKSDIHLAYQCKGLIESDAQNYTEAEKAFRAALKLSEELKMPELHYYALYQLGRMFADEGSKASADSAVKYLKLSKDEMYAQEDEMVLSEILYEFARAFRNNGNYKLSSYYALRFAEFNDSLVKDENARIMAELSEKYESVKNEAKITELNLIQQQKQQQINRQMYFIIGAAVILVLVVIVAFSLYRSNQIRKRVNNQLNEKNKLIERQKEIVDSKNKAILDSIYYAKRIQQSLLPSKKYLERNLESLKKKSDKS